MTLLFSVYGAARELSIVEPSARRRGVARALVAGVRRGDCHVETQRMRCAVIGDRGFRIGVEFNDDPTGLVGEKVRVGRIFPCAGDLEAQMLHIPGGVAAGVGNVEGEVLEFHPTKVGALYPTLKSAFHAIAFPA